MELIDLQNLALQKPSLPSICEDKENSKPSPERAETPKRRKISGARGRSRTADTAIFSRMLYQLSYPGKRADKARRDWERCL